MMKTLCVAVVVLLSLTSVCQPASLACEKLLKPVEQGPALSGTWYLIAASSDNCMATTLVNALLLLSIQMDVTPKDTPNIYDSIFKAKISGHCENETSESFYENSTIFDIDSNNAPYGDPDVLLQSGCPDCIVLKGADAVSMFLLFSRRQNVTAAELKEFETQTECLSWSKPIVFNTDHNYDNCPSIGDVKFEADPSGFHAQIYQRLKTNRREIIKCLEENALDNYVSILNELARIFG